MIENKTRVKERKQYHKNYKLEYQDEGLDIFKSVILKSERVIFLQMRAEHNLLRKDWYDLVVSSQFLHEVYVEVISALLLRVYNYKAEPLRQMFIILRFACKDVRFKKN